ncbi:MAG: glycoside hydrolase family 43 protein [Ruminiclostridium sp.]|nr:glycoside hydrolase family 43 protein [Ruminiclostridium sp.]
MNTFKNPIMPGFYPDPSICRVEVDYYLVTSSFEYFPGIPIFHSRDLVHWKQIGHVLDRPSQLNLDGVKPSGGIYAPTIRYNSGAFYIITTNIGRGGNFIVTAKDPAGPWSDPCWLEDESYAQKPPNSVIPWADKHFRYEDEPVLFVNAPGIDPSLYFDEDGRVYYTGNRKPEDGKQHWSDREIWLQELDMKTMKLAGKKYSLWKGCGGAFAEAPHLYKVNGCYYLMIAEGGTFHDHAVTIARSKNISGPYESNPRNPILTHRHLGLDYPIVNAGHADLVQTQNGEWWMAALASRPYGGYYTNLGRETFLMPVIWEDGWPVVSPGTGCIESEYSCPGLPAHFWPASLSCDHFESQSLGVCWNFLRTPREKFWSLTARPGYLSLSLRPQMISKWENPSFVCRRLQHISFSACTAMEFLPDKPNEEAGIALLQNNNYHFRFIYTMDKGNTFIKLIKRKGGSEELLAERQVNTRRLYLKVEAHEQDYSFYFASGYENWELLADKADGRILSTQVAGGFVGAYIGMYASSNGESSENVAEYDWFEYNGIF